MNKDRGHSDKAIGSDTPPVVTPNGSEGSADSSRISPEDTPLLSLAEAAAATNNNNNE